MAIPPLLKRRAAEAASQPSSDANELLARTRARRRLMGAAVLLVGGVIAFPLLFETQPRPVPVDIPMVIPSRESAAPLAPPPRPSRSISGTIAEPTSIEARSAASVPSTPSASAPLAGAAAPAAPAAAVAAAGTLSGKVLPVERLPPPPEKPAAKAEVKPPEKAASKPAPKPEPKAEPKPEIKAAPKVEPKAETKATAPKVEAKTAVTQPGRYVVQVGAYADEASAREARQKVERLGLKTYTQEVEVQGAKRIRVRVGPFDSTQEANKALATLKAGKLPGAVLTL